MDTWQRQLLTRLPFIGQRIRALDTFTRDHLELAQAHSALEHAYLALKADYHVLEGAHQRLEHEHDELRAMLHRLARPDLGVDTIQEPAEHNGIPIPPPILRYWVANSDNLEWFLSAGAAAAESIAVATAQHAAPIDQLDAILDFGCGCGRLIRHLPTYTSARLYGSDLNEGAISWCRQNMPFATFEVNQLAPPLPYASQSFDMITALSVFTHLPSDLQRPWFDELLRVARPGGHLVLSLHGEAYLDQLNPSEQELFRRGQIVVREQSLAGHNSCSAMHPYRYVEQELARNCHIAAFIPRGATGNPHQDLYILQVR